MRKDRIILILFGLSLILLITSAILALTGLTGIKGSIVVHFNSKGIADFISDISVVWSIIWSAGFMCLINFVLAYILYSREKILSYILSSGALLLSLLTLITILTVVSIN